MKERTITCIIVEDESLAAEVVKDYLDAFPNIELVAHCRDAITAIEILKTQVINLIFLDIELPKLKGFDFLRTLTNCPQVIITSGHHEYALQGFEYNVTDYLMKPIAFSRFAKAVDKAVHRFQPYPSRLQPGLLSAERKFLFFDIGDKWVRVFLDEINYVESCREYVKVHYAARSLLTRVKISDVEQALLADSFIRIHRSYIININKVEAYTHDEIEIAQVVLPVSRSYKDQLHFRLQPVRSQSLKHPLFAPLPGPAFRPVSFPVFVK